MPDTTYILAGVAVSASVTWALRALPFAVLAPLRTSDTIAYLATRMSAGVMVILVVYCLRDVPSDGVGAALSVVPPLTITVVLQLWRRNALLSILAGTLISVALSTAAGSTIV